jgi:hypothetical protein
MTIISYDDVRVGDKIRATYTWRDQDVVRTGVVARRTPDGSLWTEKGTVIVGPASQGLTIELLEREVAVGTVAGEWVYIGGRKWMRSLRGSLIDFEVREGLAPPVRLGAPALGEVRGEWVYIGGRKWAKSPDGEEGGPVAITDQEPER